MEKQSICQTQILVNTNRIVVTNFRRFSFVNFECYPFRLNNRIYKFSVSPNVFQTSVKQDRQSTTKGAAP